MAKKSKYASELKELQKNNKNITWLLVGLVFSLGVLVAVSYNSYQARIVIAEVLDGEGIDPAPFVQK